MFHNTTSAKSHTRRSCKKSYGLHILALLIQQRTTFWFWSWSSTAVFACGFWPQEVLTYVRVYPGRSKFMGNTMIPETSQLVMREQSQPTCRHPEASSLIIGSLNWTGWTCSITSCILFHERVYVLHIILISMGNVPVTCDAIKNYMSIIDGQAALLHILTMMETRYREADWDALIVKRKFNLELISRAGTTK